MNEEEVFTRLKSVISSVVSEKEIIDKLTLDSNLTNEFHFDSISMLMMAISIEREFGIEIASIDMNKFITVRDFVNYIKDNYEE